MKKIRTKLFSLLIALCLILTMAPTAVFAETAGTTGSTGSTDVFTKTKTATNLDANFDSEVTLSIAKKSETKIVDIVFVIDCTSVAEHHHQKMYDQLTEIKTELQNFEGENKPQINVAFVGFGNSARTFQGLTDLETLNIDTSLEDIKKWASGNGGTNIQKGILAGKTLLDNSSTGTTPDCRYMVLLTDGGGFWYNRDNKDDGESVQSVLKIGTTVYAMSNSDSNGDCGPNAHQTDSMYLRVLNDASSPEEAFARFISEQGEAIEASAKDKSSRWEIKFAQIGWGNVPAFTPDQVGEKDKNGNWTIYPYTDMERGTYFAAKALERVKDAGYQIKTIGYEYTVGLASKSLTETTTGFKEWTATVGDYYDGSNETNETYEIFGDIKTKFFNQGIEAGTVIVDEMGYGEYDDGKPYDLDFVNDIDKYL